MPASIGPSVVETSELFPDRSFDRRGLGGDQPANPTHQAVALAIPSTSVIGRKSKATMVACSRIPSSPS
jgi:hypothetical protein